VASQNRLFPLYINRIINLYNYLLYCILLILFEQICIAVLFANLKCILPFLSLLYFILITAVLTVSTQQLFFYAKVPLLMTDIIKRGVNLTPLFSSDDISVLESNLIFV